MDDHPKEYCGVFGVLDPALSSLGHHLYYGMFALQHRGQESCGMAVYDNDQLRIHKDMGLVNQVFSQSMLEKMTGQVGLGHTRYSTTGASHLDNAQPVVARTRLGAITLAHNGNLINTRELRDFLKSHGVFGVGDSDSHLMAHYIRHVLQEDTPQGERSLIDAVQKTLQACRGAFSIVVASGDTLIAARDPHGIRPLCYGLTDNGGVVIASETCALDIVGARYERDVAPGEILAFTLDGRTEQAFLPESGPERFCFFELVYFARPDSRLFGHSVYHYRLGLGKRLAQISAESGLGGSDADYVVPVPDSGNVAAVGYSQESGIPYMEGLIKNRYVGRTFIHPSQELRQRSIQLKLNPLTDVLRGKSIVVIDDSIVRGNTSRKLVEMFRACGVREIHMRISSAQVKHPCFYGIDMSQEDELIANQMDVDAIRRWLGVDSLAYLSPQDMQAVGLGLPYCMACFNNDYPAGRPPEPTRRRVSSRSEKPAS
ncbi:MAG: amidophosphoribosyltransferase [Vampirovibrionales bacterium]|nr:amidophosphoribosyltransferase [Vampirovibrionales bacterium]